MNTEQKAPQTVSEIYKTLTKGPGDSLTDRLLTVKISEHESLVTSESGRIFIWDKEKEPGEDLLILDKLEGRHIDDESEARDLIPYDLPNIVAYKLNDEMLDRVERAAKALSDVGGSSLYIENGVEMTADRFVNDDSRQDNDDDSILTLEDFDSHIKVASVGGMNFGVWLNSEGGGGERVVTLSSYSLIFEESYPTLRREAVLDGGYLRTFAWGQESIARDALSNMLSEQPSPEAESQLDREVAAGLLARLTFFANDDNAPIFSEVERVRPGAIEILLVERFDFDVPENIDAMLNAISIKAEGHRSSGRKLKL